jgi:hypothetical protein
MPVSPKAVEEKFLSAVNHHINGWREKIAIDFSESSYQTEIAALQSDPVYSRFALDSPEYVLVRLTGRMSISIGRRLGEIYDKLPRFVAAARFNVSPEQVAEKFSGLELDIGLRYAALSPEDQMHVKSEIKNLGANPDSHTGVGIEIRYNFNPNDSSRLRKDCEMAELLIAAGLFPVYLIYSSISPRDEAIARLKRAGWTFLQGDAASNFTTQLFAINFTETMTKPEVWGSIQENVRSIMKGIFTSPAFQKVQREA